MYAYSTGINTNWTAVVVHSTGASVMHCVRQGITRVDILVFEIDLLIMAVGNYHVMRNHEAMIVEMWSIK